MNDMKTKGQLWISIGSIGHIVMGSISCLLGLLFMVGLNILGSALSGFLDSSDYSSELEGLPDVGVAVLGSIGIWAGIIIILVGVVYIVLAVQCLKRKNDLQHTTFPLVVGAIFSILSLISLFTSFNFSTFLSLFFSGSILAGAILNRQQATGSAAYAPPGYQPTPGYPGQNQQGNYYNQGQYGNPQQPPYQQQNYGNQAPYSGPQQQQDQAYYPQQPPYPYQGTPGPQDGQAPQSSQNYGVPSQYDPSLYHSSGSNSDNNVSPEQ